MSTPLPEFTAAPPPGPQVRVSLESGPGAWPILAILAAAVPFAGALTTSKIFYVRDLCLFFWCRYLFLRRSLAGGDSPLWDPYLGGGQAAGQDALNQVFHPLALLVRMLGSEVIGFNLWVATPFPLAGAGAYLLLRSRFSAAGAALGAIAFAVSGPVVSTGNFPNMSWSVATMPWVLWCVVRTLRRPSAARVAQLAVAVALQALAGEPVSFTATVIVGVAYAATVILSSGSTRARVGPAVCTVAGVGLGLGLAAVQLIPLALAVRGSWRSTPAMSGEFWSLHPLSMVQALSPHLFGNYFDSTSFLQVPWMAPLNSGRDPFFYSLYLGPFLLALAVIGLIGARDRRWSRFWGATALVGVFFACGSYTPVYPWVRAHVPPFGSFRFPAKFMVVVVISLAALAVAGWEALAAHGRGELDTPGFRRARRTAVTVLVAVGILTYGFAAIAIYFPYTAAVWFARTATWVGVSDPIEGARFMLVSLPENATRVLLLSLGAALLVGVAASRRREAGLARRAVGAMLVLDLMAHAWGINPVGDVTRLQQPRWVDLLRADPSASFYFGGKRNGTFEIKDPHSPKQFSRLGGIPPSEARAALSANALYYPSAWRVRELLSFDLAMVWPRVFEVTNQRFKSADEDERLRFLERTGVRYRVLPETFAHGRTPLVAMPFYTDVQLYDWAPVMPRVSVVPRAEVVGDLIGHIDRLLGPDLDVRSTVLLEAAAPAAAGQPGGARAPAAAITEEHNSRLVVDASVGADGGYLLVLDSYSPDWHAIVDGQPAPLLRANAIFRAVRLAPGAHRVEFVHRPASVYAGAGVTALALVCCLALVAVRRRLDPWLSDPGDGVLALAGGAPDVTAGPDREARAPVLAPVAAAVASRRRPGPAVAFSLAVATTLAGTAAAFAVFAPDYWHRGFPLDDAWIHAVYARELATTGTLAFNPGVPATGETAPGWAVALSLVHAMVPSSSVVFATKLLGLLLHALTVGLLAVIGLASTGRSRWWVVAGALAVAFQPDLVAASTSGMEVPLATCAAACLWWARLRRRRLLFGALAAAATLARPELAVIAGVLALPTSRRTVRDAVGWGAAAVGGALATILAVGVRNAYVSGAWLPATFHAKVSFSVGTALLSQYYGWGRLIGDLPGAGPWPLTAACAAIAAAAWWQRDRDEDEGIPALACAGGLAMVATSFVLIVPADPAAFYHQRYVLPALPSVLFGAVLCVAAWSRDSRRWPRIAAAVVVAGLLLPSGLALPARLSRLANDAHNIDDVQVAMGTALGSAAPTDAIWAVDVGAVRYFGRAFVVDMIGLNTPQMLSGTAASYLAAHPPRYLDVFPGWSAATGSTTFPTQRFQVSSPYTVTSSSLMVRHVLATCPPGATGTYMVRTRSFRFACAP